MKGLSSAALRKILSDKNQEWRRFQTKRYKEFVCPVCGAVRGRCGCQKVEIQAKDIPQTEFDLMGRSIFYSIQEAYKDPEFVAGYERWLAQRNAKQAQAAEG